MHSVLSLYPLWFHLSLNIQEKSILKINQQILISETIQSQAELKLSFYASVFYFILLARQKFMGKAGK